MKKFLITALFFISGLCSFGQVAKCSPEDTLSDSLANAKYKFYLFKGDSSWAKHDSISAKEFWTKAGEFKYTCEINNKINLTYGLYDCCCNDTTVQFFHYFYIAEDYFESGEGHFFIAKCNYLESLKYCYKPEVERKIRKKIEKCDKELNKK